MVSNTRNGRHRKQHHVGCRRLVPGVDYKDFEPYGAVTPPLSELHSKCKTCFGTTSVIEGPAEEESAVEPMDSSSSSSSAKEPAPKKKKTKRSSD